MAEIHFTLHAQDMQNQVLLRQFAAAFTTLAAASGTDTAPTGVVASLDMADHPDCGMPTAREAFGHADGAAGDLAALGMPSPQVAFGGAGNVAGGSPSASSPSSAPTTAGLTVTGAALVGAEGLYVGSAPNVPPAPLTQTGTPPLPAVTPPIPQPGANVPPPVSLTPPTPAPLQAGAPATAGSTSPVPLDSEGLPWDTRIHASSKEMIANGTWKLKRGIASQEVYLNQVKAQLRQAMGGTAAPAATTAPAAPLGNVTHLPPASPPTTAAPAASSALTMAHLLPRVTSAITATYLTPDQAGQIVTEVSGGAVTNVAMLAVRPDLIPAVWARLDQLGIPQ